MGLTSAELDFVEHMAQEQFRYETIFEEHAKYFKQTKLNTKRLSRKHGSHPLLRNQVNAGNLHKIRVANISQNVMKFATLFRATMKGLVLYNLQRRSFTI